MSCNLLYSSTSWVQAAVAFVSLGVLLATFSRPSSSSSSDDPAEFGRYLLGVAMMTTSLILTGVLGMLQESTYSKFGPHWREGVFYTVSSRSHSISRQASYISAIAAPVVSTNIRVLDT